MLTSVWATNFFIFTLQKHYPFCSMCLEKLWKTCRELTWCKWSLSVEMQTVSSKMWSITNLWIQTSFLSVRKFISVFLQILLWTSYDISLVFTLINELNKICSICLIYICMRTMILPLKNPLTLELNIHSKNSREFFRCDEFTLGMTISVRQVLSDIMSAII